MTAHMAHSDRMLLDSSCDPLPQAELLQLIVEAQHGSVPARNRVIASTMRFVLARANRLTAKAGRPDMRDDLVTAATCGYNGHGGLIRAIERFDVSRGTRWSTWAAHEIDLAMQGVLTAAMCDGLGRYSADRLHGIRETAERLAASGLEPAIEDIQRDYAERGQPVPKADRVVTALSSKRATVLEQMTEGDPEHELDRKRQSAELHAVIEAMVEPMRTVMLRHLRGDSLVEIGKALGLNRKQAHEIKSRAVAVIMRELG